MRRISLIAAVLVAAFAGAAVAAVAARDAVYWERPLPGVVVREVPLAAVIEVRVGAERYAVDPRTVLRVAETATATAATQRGRDSFLVRVRALADPSPQTLLVDPVLVPVSRATRCLPGFERELPRARPAQVSIGGVVPSRPGERIDRPASSGLCATRSSTASARLRHRSSPSSRS